MNDELRRDLDRYLAWVTARPATDLAYERETHSRFVALLDGSGESPLERTHVVPGHLTASVLCLAPDHDDVLLLHHRKLDRWLQPGGHVDGDACAWRAALRELREETGVVDVAFVSLGSALDEAPVPFDLDVHAIPGYGTEPAHLHYDVRYLVRAATRDLRGNHESRALRWVPRDEARAMATDASLTRMLDRLAAL